MSKIRNPNSRIKERKPSRGLPVPPHRGRETSHSNVAVPIFLLVGIYFMQIISLLQI